MGDGGFSVSSLFPDPEETYRDYEQALGRLCRYFASLELFLREMAWALIGGEESIAGVVTAGMPFQQLVFLVRSLGEARLEGDEVETLRSALIRADEVAKHRNHLIHSTWWLSFERTDERATFWNVRRGRKGIDSKVANASVADILEIAGEARQVENALLMMLVPVKKRFWPEWRAGES